MKQIEIRKNDGEVDDSNELISEAIRRYSLPFGAQGKLTNYKKFGLREELAAVTTLVIQDFRILTPAEYIFGLKPGDCISLTCDLSSGVVTPFAVQLRISHHPIEIGKPRFKHVM